MNRSTARSFAILATALLVALPSTSAIAKGSGADKPGGKHPLGTVESFDPATMTLAVMNNDASTTSMVLSADVKVKVVHRGNHAVGKGHGNPSRGSLDDLVPGTFVLNLLDHDGVVTHIRVRPAKPADITVDEVVTDQAGDNEPGDDEAEEQGEDGDGGDVGDPAPLPDV